MGRDGSEEESRRPPRDPERVDEKFGRVPAGESFPRRRRSSLPEWIESFPRGGSREEREEEEISLGMFDGFEGEDDSVMVYSSNSAACWNGPKRRVLVKTKCGLEEKLVSAVENGKCLYEFLLETPAAC